ncbi:2-amino-4-hydroxy-6-hydroxymethyldihydropteridine pyrophosphokinase [Candidatus Termititenax aidoneus]|uniref:2-amino-4-hydroxy-6-hydroxymethyldihydropteridine diphosphokinase n=1 Tax=Termititenax aidoneus TaxID=2218524 RepID=A0A388TDY7_TERA1|nr:2-amino-4-hydroxy-6-hydroxymethyldihydropteridine pyrophosphokinase [Candidatus Termititenax aidoneus]
MNVFLGLGSNLGDRAQNLRDALAELGKLEKTKILKTASFYDTAPAGYTEQPRFLNTAVQIETALPPRALLAATQNIEKKLGRAPTMRWGPRIIDIDILAYAAQIIDEPDLHVPHLELIRRLFVLEPLCEIAPEYIEARSGQTYSLLYTECLAAALAQELQPGAVVALNGELGAGKTTFARALVKALGNTAHVASPTFTILNIYPGKIPVYHFDFYRLQDAADLENTGGAEFIPPSDGVTVIEWTEKIPEILPENYLEITITVTTEQTRVFTIERH